MTALPYIGPTPLGKNQPLYGRDVESRELFHRTLAHRVLLFHAPSGAGKTSLLQAGRDVTVAASGRTVGVIARLEARGVKCWGPLRVGHPPPFDEGEVGGPFNRYTVSVITALEELGGPHFDEKDLPGLKLSEYFDALQDAHGQPEVFIFDQFEEILTVDPTDLEAKAEFLRQLDAAFTPQDTDDEPPAQRRTSSRRALFAMRSDYVGALELHVTDVLDGMRLRFCIGLFAPEAARAAIVNPARDAGVEFDIDAADALIDEMRKIIIQLPNGESDTVKGPYVEPVHLQLVCRRIWQVRDERSTHITREDVKKTGSIETALGDYYDECVAAVAKGQKLDEAQQIGGATLPDREAMIRDWFETKLITPRGIRGQVMMEAEQTAGLSNAAIVELEKRYLVAHEVRRNFTWYELSHDRFIAPIRESNRRARLRQRTAEQQLEREREARHWRRRSRLALIPLGIVLAGAVLYVQMLRGQHREAADNASQLRNQQFVWIGREALLAGRRLSAMTYFAAAAEDGITPELRTLFAQTRANLWTARVRHVYPVRAVRFDPAGAVLYTASRDELVTLRDGKPAARIPLGADDVQLSPDARWLLTRHGDRWFLSTTAKGTERFEIGAAEEVVFSPDSRRLVARFVERPANEPPRFRALTFTVESSRPGRLGSYPLAPTTRACKFSSDGRHLAFVADDGITIVGLAADGRPQGSGVVVTIPRAALVELTRDELFVVQPAGELTVHRFDSGQPARYTVPAGTVALGVTSDGMKLATLTAGQIATLIDRGAHRRATLALRSPNIAGGGGETSGGASSNFEEPSSGTASNNGEEPSRVLSSLDGEPPADAGIRGTGGTAQATAARSDASLAAPPRGDAGPGPSDAAVPVSGAGSAVELSSSELGTGDIRRASAYVMFSPDGSLLVTAGPGQVAALWDTTTAALVTTFEDSTPVESIAVAPDMSSVVLGTQDGARIWDTAAGDAYPVLVSAHDTELLTASFTPTGSVILGALDGSIQTWSPGASKTAPETTGARWVASTGWIASNTKRDAPVLAVASDGVRTWAITRGELYSFDDSGGARALQLQVNTGAIGSSHVAAGLASSKMLIARRETLLAGSPPEPAKLVVNARLMRFAADDRLVTIDDDKRSVEIWSSDGQPVYACEKCDAASDVDLSPDGTQLAVAGTRGLAIVSLGRERVDVVTALPMLGVRFAAATSLVTAGFDRSIRIWDTARRTSVVGVEHEDAISVLVLSPDRTRGCSASRDGVVKLWDTTSGKLLMRPWSHRSDSADRVTSAAFSADGKRVVSTGRDGTAWVWQLPSDDTDLDAWKKLEDQCSPFDVDDMASMGIPGLHAKANPGEECGAGAAQLGASDHALRARSLQASAVALLGSDPAGAGHLIERAGKLGDASPGDATKHAAIAELATWLAGMSRARNPRNSVKLAYALGGVDLAQRALNRIGDLGNDVELLILQIELELGTGAYHKAQDHARTLLFDQDLPHGRKRTRVYAMWWAAAYLSDDAQTPGIACKVVNKGYRNISPDSLEDNEPNLPDSIGPMLADPFTRMVALMADPLHDRERANRIARVFRLLTRPVSPKEERALRDLVQCR